MIKKIIYSLVEEKINELVEEKIEKLASDLYKIHDLEKRTDKEIIEIYKHTKFKDISSLEKKFLFNKYNFFVVSYSYSVALTKMLNFECVVVEENCYISDEIEKILKSKEESNNDNN